MKHFIILFVSVGFFTLSKAQNTEHFAVSAGGSEQNLSWTIGETVSSTNDNGNIILTQGLHQTYYILTSSEQQTTQKTEIKVYPNPFVNEFFISFSDNDSEHRVVIMTIDGKKIAEQNSSDSQIRIATENLSASNYILTVYSENQIISTFNIIKR